jgi:hypothetical protein
MLSKLTVALFSLVLLSPTTQTPIQPPQSAGSPKSLQILIEGDSYSALLLKKSLAAWAGKLGISMSFVEKDINPYDLRIFLTSAYGSESRSCSESCSPISDISSSCTTRCSVSITISFLSAVVLTPDGKLQFTETGVETSQSAAMIPLARKLAKRLSIMPNLKVPSQTSIRITPDNRLEG